MRISGLKAMRVIKQRFSNNACKDGVLILIRWLSATGQQAARSCGNWRGLYWLNGCQGKG